MTKQRRRLAATAAALVGLTGLAAGCGGEGETLTIYSGREEEIVESLLQRFEQETGVEIEMRFGDSAELAATIEEEGDNSPADLFFSQDAGALGSIESQLAELPAELLSRVDERYRDPQGRWVGTSGRARVIVYNTDLLSEREVPDWVVDLTDPRWRGKVGVAPTNASFQAFVTAMRLTQGDRATRAWLEALRANDVRFYEKNTPIVEAVAAGEIELGLVNHYYLFILKQEQPAAPVANHFPNPGDPGALVNVAGVGILATSDQADAARRFVEFLLSESAQRFYVEEAQEAEYPLVEGVEPPRGLPPLDRIQGPGVALGDLGPELEQTIRLLTETGYLS